MYLILFDKNKQANCITHVKDDLTKEEIFLFDKLPDFTPQEGYANSLHLNNDGQLEWHFTKLPPQREITDEEREEMMAHTLEYQSGYDRAVLDMTEVEE